MKTITYDRNAFSLTKLTDTELVILAKELSAEQNRRAEENENRRREWVNIYYYNYLNNLNASSVLVGETTIVAIYDKKFGMRIGKATPVHGDVFNRNTGIAVAYAKANNETIPDFI